MATLLKMSWIIHEDLEAKIVTKDCKYEEKYAFQISFYLKTHGESYDP